MIRILVLENQPEVRKGLQMRLSAEVDMSVVGGEASLRDPSELIATIHPDIVLVDIDMPNQIDLSRMREVCSHCPNTAIVVLSILDDQQTRSQAYSAGASELVSKTFPTDSLLETIRRVAQDRIDSSRPV